MKAKVFWSRFDMKETVIVAFSEETQTVIRELVGD
jgi:hypothetical protein